MFYHQSWHGLSSIQTIKYCEFIRQETRETKIFQVDEIGMKERRNHVYYLGFSSQ